MRLESDNVELTVLPEVGGRIHRLRAFGTDVVRSPSDPSLHRRDPFYWGSYPMLPWCGRVGTDPVEVAGRTIRLPQNHPDGWAIHGQAYVAPWDAVDERTLRFHFEGDDGWPWRYEAEMAFDVGPAVSRVDLSLKNTDDGAMPAGIGLHPWFKAPVLVQVPAALVFDDNTVSNPQPKAVSGSTDLRSARELEVGVDTTWTGLTGYMVELVWLEHELRATMLVETSGNLVIVAARLPTMDDAIALEPQTHAPQGLRRLVNGEPDAMTLLPPGETLRLSATLHFARGQ